MISKKWMRVARVIAKCFVIAVLPVLMAIQDQYFFKEINKSAGLNGAYRTEVFVVNNDTLRSVDDRSKRWSKMILDDSFAEVTIGNDSLLYYDVAVDTIHKKIALTNYSDSTDKYSISYKLLPKNQFIASWVHRSDSVVATFKRKVQTDYLLVKHRLHWIHEY